MRNRNRVTARALQQASSEAQPMAVLNATCRRNSPESSAEAESVSSDWLTASEAAKYLKVKPRTLLSWARKGTIKAYPLSGTKRRIWRFRREDLDDALFSRSVLRSSTPTVLSQERRLV